MEGILGLIIAALAGLLFISNRKRSSAEALNEQGSVLSDLAKADGMIAANKVAQDAEAAKREKITADADKEKKQDESLQNLKKFFDDSNN